ncbi:MFS transporter [Haladaptatus halobius]|uniref:MFS transporter n=1 Tax=Haladaptatus halobius TaxID=2884875 RepID=UPI001D0B59CF|nr:MFS transporter [Haladaptatus halobius]
MEQKPVTHETRQLYALYFTRFASSFGLITLLTLLPKYINLFDPSGVVIGLFTTGLTLAQAIAVIPIAWAGDRYDKRAVLLGSLGIGILAYGAFAFVSSSVGFILTRGFQGIAATGMGLLGLALVGELAPRERRANIIGVSNSWRFAAAILGTLSAGILYEVFGFTAVFGLLVIIISIAFVSVWLFVEPDTTRVEGFAFSDLAVNRRILTITSFRAQYAIAVTLIRTWIPIYAGVSALKGGLAYSTVAVSVVIVAEKFTNMISQPYLGQLSDRFGRSLFIFIGGGLYGIIALLVPFSPIIGAALPVPATIPLLGKLSTAFIPLVALNGLLGIADSFREPASMALFADEGADSGGVASSFGVRSIVWRPGSIIAPLIGGFLMTNLGMEWVFYAGAVASLTGIGLFVGILSYTYGRGALTQW